MTNLSPNFTLEELTHTDHRELDNTPTEHEKCIVDGKEEIINAAANLPRLAAFLEQIKVVLGGKPIMVNSAFRSKGVNDAVGSSDTSDHRRGGSTEDPEHTLSWFGGVIRRGVRPCTHDCVSSNRISEPNRDRTRAGQPPTTSARVLGIGRNCVKRDLQGIEFGNCCCSEEMDELLGHGEH